MSQPRVQIEPCCSVQALSGRDDAHPCWGRPPAVLSLPTQMPITPRPLPDTPRKNAASAIRASHGPVNLMHKINNYTK